MTDLLRAVDRGRMPLFIRVYQLMRKRLETGEWSIGDQLPTIEQLMAEYEVSRATIREAMGQLEQDALISRTRGRGTYVTRNIIDERWLILPTNWRQLLTHIEKLNARVVELGSGKAFPNSLQHDEKLLPSYWWARRVNYTQTGKPYALTETYLASSIYRSSPGRFSRRPILPLLASVKPDLVQTASQRLAISTASVQSAKYLQMEIGAPVAEVRLVVRDGERNVVYFGMIYYPARHLVIETELL